LSCLSCSLSSAMRASSISPFHVGLRPTGGWTVGETVDLVPLADLVRITKATANATPAKATMQVPRPSSAPCRLLP
jgi:hypothetical protein